MTISLNIIIFTPQFDTKFIECGEVKLCIVIFCGFIPHLMNTQEDSVCFCLMVILIVQKKTITNMLFNTKIGNTEYILIVIGRIVATLYNAWCNVAFSYTEYGKCAFKE